ncbi:MAG TPA: nuclear transport factor 2 family protein [Streptosporangiaceae bacterium]|jgi:hypothetical protein
MPTDPAKFAETLTEIEYRQWRALTSTPDAVAFYSDLLSPDSVMAVPSRVMTRDQVIKAVGEASPINLYELYDVQVIQLSDDSGVITYRMTQGRVGREPFKAAISTVYVRRDGRWYIAYHQQTPMLVQ